MHVDSINTFICPTNAHNSYKISKLLNSFKIVIVAPTCFHLHKPSSGNSQPVLRGSCNVDIGYIYRFFEVIGTVAAYFVQYCYACGVEHSSTPHSAQSTVHKRNRTEQNMQPQYR